LDSEALRRAKHSLQLGRQRDLHRFVRRQLGRLRLHQRNGENQTNPSRIPCGSKHPRLNLDRNGFSLQVKDKLIPLSLGCEVATIPPALRPPVAPPKATILSESCVNSE